MSSASATHAARTSRSQRDDRAAQRSLTRQEKRTVALLGIPTLALALVVTLVTTYVPVVAQEFVGSTVVIGLIVGLEGLVALWLPLVVGSWSDRLDTRLGGRAPFLIAATPLIAIALIAIGLAGSVAALGAAGLVFFVGYFLAYEPYRALYPDATGDDIAGRAQATQAVWRGAGTGVALVSGGLLLGLGRGAPFFAGAAILLGSMAAFAVALARRGVPDQERRDGETPAQAARRVWRLVKDQVELRAFLAANALWELSLAALKTFVVLYVTKGLGYGRATAALMIGGVAVVVLLAALVSGKLADRYGRLRVLGLALPVYGLAFLVPLLFSTPIVVAATVPLIAIGGGVIMALPYAALMPLMPDDEHGALTGCYSFSRGLGTWLGPLFGGLAITALAGVFSGTQGYQAVWGVCAAAVLLSLIPLQRLRRAVGE